MVADLGFSQQQWRGHRHETSKEMAHGFIESEEDEGDEFEYRQ